MIRETQWMTAWGRMAMAHWRRYRPKMVKKLVAAGSLRSAVMEAQNRAQEEFGRLVESGTDPEAARETVLARWILLPEEPEKLDPSIDPALLAPTLPSPTTSASAKEA